MEKPNSITRTEFIKRFMHDAGLSYSQACAVYDCMISTMEDAVITGSKVNFGRLGALVPQWMPPRAVNMGFERTADNTISKTQRTYFLGKRIRYKFHLYKEFIKSHSLRWFVDEPQPEVAANT